jgi:TRAP-type mannitol/chloroaromatic compound transport system permease small subunit
VARGKRPGRASGAAFEGEPEATTSAARHGLWRMGGDVRALLAVSRVIDAINTRIGRWLAWLILATVLISAANATIRKVFDTSSNAWLELQWVLFGIVFLMCSPWTLLSNEHIRIDIVNSMFPKKVRNLIDIVGHIFFLLPMCAVMIYTSYPFFTRSFAINEQSMNAGGLPQWPAKSLLVIAFTLLFVQGISELIKRTAIMTGDLADTISGGGHHAAAEEEVKRLLAELKTEDKR